VVVWLGPKSTNSDLAIARINTGIEGTGFPFSKRLWTQEEGKALHDLFRRNYWTRIWTVQEFIFAKDITLHYGKATFSWPSLAAIFEFLNHDIFLDSRMDHRRAELIRTTLAGRTVSQRIRIGTDSGRPLLLDLVRTYEDMTSTDVREKVFGLLGLAEGSGVPRIWVVADYERSAEEVYWDFVGQCYRGHGRLCRGCGWFARAMHGTTRLPEDIAPRVDEWGFVNWKEGEGKDGSVVDDENAGCKG
jgi:hypothetical protein